MKFRFAITSTLLLSIAAIGPLARTLARSDPYEPNDSRGAATHLRAGTTYTAGIDTLNDQDWYVFRGSRTHRVQTHLTVVKGDSGEAGDVIHVVRWVNYKRLNTSNYLVASDQPGRYRFTLPKKANYFVMIEDGCSPHGCGEGPYSIHIEK